MKNKINKSNIVILALVYAYLSNRETQLKEWDLDRFFLNIRIAMYNNPMATEIADEEIESQEVYYRDEKDNYVLKRPELLPQICRKYIDNIPEEIFFESLKEDNLSQINVDRNKLKIVAENEHKYETVELASMSASSAISSARIILEGRGCKNIQINGTYFAGMRDDYVWGVQTSYDKDRFYLDLGEKEKGYTKRYMYKNDSIDN